MTHYFRPSPSMPNIYLYRDPVDFRKSYRGAGRHRGAGVGT